MFDSPLVLQKYRQRKSQIEEETEDWREGPPVNLGAKFPNSIFYEQLALS